ncbi:MAG: hypothetical protein M0P77_09810 [Firmicutes bacterium]|nr:hypothetical protein [Bacillota bacterium]
MIKRSEHIMFVYYLIGAAIGSLIGYLVLYRLIGCSTRACAITANPYTSTIYGIILGILLTNIIVPSQLQYYISDCKGSRI